MNDLLFIRHAETDMAGAFCGQSDPPINAAGHRQIARLIESLRSESIATVFTSDLERALTTARGIAELSAVPCEPRRNLREIDFGAWEGLTWEQIEAFDSTFAQQWLDRFPYLTAPQGESFKAFQARILAEISDLVRQPQEGQVAVVTHAGVMRVVLQNLCGVDEKTAWALSKPYCCIFRYKAHARAVEHLQGVQI
jgi:alpha-ribazole phosphatase